ncbi:fibrobacter succinogenes major paralogous domain-containing protein [Shewanella maritima]|uniref:fibrobacter succinogenes major paralogous domain-containing protein n=1 Tax=Shewanella maritima TaxID=2520507 RepID=UPI003736F469
MNTITFLLGVLMLTPTESINHAKLVEAEPAEVVVDAQGNQYRTVKIGLQTWLAENLRSTQFQDGTPVNTGFIPNDDETLLNQYGRVYSWEDVSNPNNLCPVGWRVATDEDWKQLERTIGIEEDAVNSEGWRGDKDIANTIKTAQPNTLFKSFDQSLVNKYQFFATPAGVKIGNWYIAQGKYTEFWTATNVSEKKAFARTLAYAWWNPHKGEIRRAPLNKKYMFSVRCVKNETQKLNK